MADIRQRRFQADYINVGTEASPQYEFMGAGFTALNETPGAQVSEKRYINDASSSRSISGYSPQYPFTAEYIKSEAAISFIADIARERKTGLGAETTYVMVDIDETAAGGAYPARRAKVAVEVANFNDDAGQYVIDGNLNGIGDLEQGTFNVETKTFTPTATVTP